MAGISVTGLISNSFDWKSVVDQLIAIDSQPIARLQGEEAENNDKLASLGALNSYLTDLSSSAIDLRSATLFKSRVATSSTSGSTWSLTPSDSATQGSYTIAVSQLATASKRVGASGVSTSISATNDVSGTTLATLPTSTAITAGNFTVNGQTITVALTDSLQDVFDAISTATGGTVTASYDSTTDKVTLSSAGEIELGAVNDSSNFLSALRLANNGTGTITSSGKLGSASLTATLASSRLAGAFSADSNGDGSFTINGVSIGYNVNTDTLKTVLSKINSSSAGVTASYDATNDRFLLVNNSTGDIGIGANEVSGGLADAMGLTSGSSLQRGNNAQFTVNGGDTITTTSNTLTSSQHGITGLSIKVDSTGTQTITVAANTTKMKAALQDFIDKFNTVQALIESETAVTTGADGKIVSATLGGNQEVERWGTKLRSLAFQSISGLSSTVDRLDDLGIDFDSISSQLKIKDEAKLDAALRDNSDDIAGFFNNTSTGFAQQFSTYLTNLLSASSGALATQSATLTNQNKDLETQIATLNRRLEDQRTQLTNAFLAMQNAQSTAANQQKSIEDMFFKKNDN
jgi:flagellar hook-associated protein 2